MTLEDDWIEVNELLMDTPWLSIEDIADVTHVDECTVRRLFAIHRYEMVRMQQPELPILWALTDHPCNPERAIKRNHTPTTDEYRRFMTDKPSESWGWSGYG